MGQRALPAKVAASSRAKFRIACDDGNGNTVFSKKIGYTDFPLAEISLYCCNKTILLPSEY